ncbi:hypothetical protein SO802_013513 [Lithocarpus litseifolius]|uniref:Uncharacterized protein n=1 Tax=Lithocarpus litseifolius TaxID=425828 RepID=A0AAW2D6D4_9ROSI
MREIWLDLDMLGEPLKNDKEKEIIGSLSPQVSTCEEDGPILTEGKDTSIKTLSIDEMRSLTITETLDPKFKIRSRQHSRIIYKINQHDLLQETPIAEWIDSVSENASFTLTIFNPKGDNFDGLSGTIFDDILPFFEGDCPKKRKLWPVILELVALIPINLS